jgi:hypothetical protein
MARTPEQISNNIRSKLQLIDPDISTEPLTPERKIIDTVAETIAEAEIDNYVLNYQMDIDTKVGADLDRFVALFGFARQGGRRATGNITLSRSIASDRDIVIPLGTQVIKLATTISPAIVFQTTATVVLYTGTTEVEAPIEALVSGTNGNVPAQTITSLGTTTTGDISFAINENATTGGTEIETDAELRIRFKNTIFRNVTGTQDQYLALSIASRFTKKANVIGPISRFSEFLQVANNQPSPGSTGAISLIPYSKFTYPFDYFVTDGDLANENYYSPGGVDYTFNTTTPPSFTVVNTTTLPIETVVLMEHAYCSKNSRNDPANGIANYVDVYISGEDVTNATETLVFPTAANDLVSSSSSIFSNVNYQRYEDGQTSVVGNRLQTLL